MKAGVSLIIYMSMICFWPITRAPKNSVQVWLILMARHGSFEPEMKSRLMDLPLSSIIPISHWFIQLFFFTMWWTLRIAGSDDWPTEKEGEHVLYREKCLVLTSPWGISGISHLLFCTMPPPPPPPICFPFIKSKPKRRLSFDSLQSPALPHPDEKNIVRHPAFSPTSTMSSDAASLTFHSDSELYDDVPDHLPMLSKDQSSFPKLGRSNAMTGTKKSTASSKWGYGWGVGKKNKEKGGELEINEKSASQVDLPLYQPVVRRDSKSTQASHSTQRSHDTHRTQDSRHTQNTQRTQESHRTHVSQQSKFSQGSKNTYRSNSSRSTAPKPRPPLINGHVLYPQDSTDTLVGSAFERKVNEQDSIRIKPNTTERLEDMRRLMIKDKLDY